MNNLKALEFSPDDELLFSILRDLREGRDAVETLVAIASALCAASEGAIAIGKQLKLFPNKHLVGFNKYSQMQDAFLVAGQELDLPIIKVPHPGTSTYYAALEHPRLRLTLGHVQKYTNNPKLRPFRLNSRLAKYRPWQLSLIDKLNVPPDKQLVGTIVYGYGLQISPRRTSWKFDISTAIITCRFH